MTSDVVRALVLVDEAATGAPVSTLTVVPHRGRTVRADGGITVRFPCERYARVVVYPAVRSRRR